MPRLLKKNKIFSAILWSATVFNEQGLPCARAIFELRVSQQRMMNVGGGGGSLFFRCYCRRRRLKSQLAIDAWTLRWRGNWGEMEKLLKIWCSFS